MGFLSIFLWLLSILTIIEHHLRVKFIELIERSNEIELIALICFAVSVNESSV